MADNEVIIEVTARLDKAEAALRKLEGQAEKSGEKAGSALGDGLSKGAAIGFKALAVAATAALAGIVVVFKKGIDAAVEQENAINALNAALARTGQFSEATSRELDVFADSLEKITVFSGDAILQNAALIQSLGGLSKDGLKGATQAAVDLSAALGIDLRAASQLVGRAAAGEVASLSRYGLVIQEGATKAETFANALSKINQQFGGAAAAQAKTFSGSLTRLQNTFGKLLEEVGNIIIKSPELAAVFRFISGVLTKAAESVRGFSGDSGLRGILLTSIDIARFFTGTLGPVFDVIANVVAGLGRAIGGLASALVSFVTGDFKGAFDTIAQVSAESLEDVKNVFTTGGTDAAIGFIEGLRTAVETAPPLMQELKNVVQSEVETFNDISFSGLVNSFRMTVTQMNDLAKSVTAQIKGTFISGFSSAFSAIGGALVKGENAFKAFGKAILGMFGDIAIQLGQFYLTLGLANLFLNPAAAAGQLAGGAALLVLGGALKALAGGGGGEAAAATGGTSAASAPVGTSPANLQDTEAQAPGTAVTVNVQGNILDRRETGLEIAQIINESFATGGIVIARGAVG